MEGIYIWCFKQEGSGSNITNLLYKIEYKYLIFAGKKEALFNLFPKEKQAEVWPILRWAMEYFKDDNAHWFLKNYMQDPSIYEHKDFFEKHKAALQGLILTESDSVKEAIEKIKNFDQTKKDFTASFQLYQKAKMANWQAKNSDESSEWYLEKTKFIEKILETQPAFLKIWEVGNDTVGFIPEIMPTGWTTNNSGIHTRIKNIRTPKAKKNLEQKLRDYKYKVSASTDHSIHTDESGKFWGNEGAGGVFYCKKTGRVCLQKRSQYVNEPNTWGTWGGSREPGETVEQALRREVSEEAHYPGHYILKHVYTHKDGKFQYHNYLIIVENEFEPKHSWETSDHLWCTLDTLPNPLHFGLRLLIPKLQVII